MCQGEKIEKQVVDWLKNVVQSASTVQNGNAVEEARELEARFERASNFTWLVRSPGRYRCRAREWKVLKNGLQVTSVVLELRQQMPLRHNCALV